MLLDSYATDDDILNETLDQFWDGVTKHQAICAYVCNLMIE